jgi:diacylglycerol O-acyltransferase
VDFGIIACRRTMPQVQRLIDYMEQSLCELEEAAGLSVRGAKRKASPTSKAKPKAKEKSKVKPKSKAKAKAKGTARRKLRN